MKDSDSRHPPAIFLMGPTASGKTNAAVALSQTLPIELISVDSALVFTDMDIGTAKPDKQTLALAPHHLINITPPTIPYSAADFRKDALHLMHEISARGKTPVLVGGTMLYFKALEEGLSGLPEANQDVRAKLDAEAAELGWPAMHQRLANIDPVTAQRLKPNDMQRIQRALEVYEITGLSLSEHHRHQTAQTLPFTLSKIAMVPSDRQVLHDRIAVRFRQMIIDGLVDEVRGLTTQYPTLTADSTSMRCVGYRQTLAYLRGDYDLSELENRGIYATRQLAKRQLTWLRNMTNTMEIDCLDTNCNSMIKSKINQIINR